jgi:hypothetical protein
MSTKLAADPTDGSRDIVVVLLWEQLLNPSEALQRLWKELE